MNYVNSAVSGLMSVNPFAASSTEGKANEVKNAKADNNDGDDGCEHDVPALSEEQLRKKEGALAYMLRVARNKYISRGLEGKITIQMLYGVIMSGEYCTVTMHDSLEEVDDSDARNLGTLNFKALSAMDAILANLSRRSKARESVDHISGTTLTQGIVFGISFPFIISIGFQTIMQFEVTVASMVAYRKKKEKLRLIEKKLKAIPESESIIADIEAGGYTHDVAQKAVIATNGASVEAALRWAVNHDKESKESNNFPKEELNMKEV